MVSCQLHESGSLASALTANFLVTILKHLDLNQ